MKSLTVKLMAAALVLAVAGSAWARPPYKGFFETKYEGLKAAAAEAKCNVCHEGMEKKNRNDYGKALGTALPKAKFDELKGDADALKKAFMEAATKVEDEKAADGKTFGEIIKSGKLPGAK